MKGKPGTRVMEKPLTTRQQGRAAVGNRTRGVYVRSDGHIPKPIRATNIAVGGVGIDVSHFEKLPERGTVIQAVLSVGRASAKVKIKLVHVSAGVAGFQFIGAPSTLSPAIALFFNPELMGAGGDEERIQRYSSTSGTMLETVIRNGVLCSWKLHLLDGDISWKAGEAITHEEYGNKESLNDYLRGQVLQLVRSAVEIPTRMREELEKAILTA
jgi:hypothetical protein